MQADSAIFLLSLRCSALHCSNVCEFADNLSCLRHILEGLIFVHDGRTDRNFSEMPGKLCFARLKAGLNKLKLETKLG
eukprot:scaffold15599_cov129-Skeletonema_dohrnii-CCMP3373.AAC.1